MTPADRLPLLGFVLMRLRARLPAHSPGRKRGLSLLKGTAPSCGGFAPKKVSGTFRRSKLQRLLGLESSRHLFWGLASIIGESREGDKVICSSPKSCILVRKPATTVSSHYPQTEAHLHVQQRRVLRPDSPPGTRSPTRLVHDGERCTRWRAEHANRRAQRPVRRPGAPRHGSHQSPSGR